MQARTIALNEALLEEEVARGNLRLPVDAHTMAYALVRIVESFLYADMISGEKPDLAKADADPRADAATGRRLALPTGVGRLPLPGLRARGSRARVGLRSAAPRCASADGVGLHLAGLRAGIAALGRRPSLGCASLWPISSASPLRAFARGSLALGLPAFARLRLAARRPTGVGLLAEPVLLHLAGLGARQRRHRDELARQLEAREPLGAATRAARSGSSAAPSRRHHVGAARPRPSARRGRRPPRSRARRGARVDAPRPRPGRRSRRPRCTCRARARRA